MTKNLAHKARMIGAVAPSLSPLAHCMAKYVAFGPQKQLILEVGGGTGAITKVLLQKLGVDDELDVVEALPAFASILRSRFKNISALKIHCTDIRHFSPPKKYDRIVSSLPFNSLGPQVVGPIIDHLLTLSADDAIWSFFEFMGVKAAAPMLLRASALQDFFISRSLVNRVVDLYQFEDCPVYLNFPPARVRFLRIKKSSQHVKLS